MRFDCQLVNPFLWLSSRYATIRHKRNRVTRNLTHSLLDLDFQTPHWTLFVSRKGNRHAMYNTKINLQQKVWIYKKIYLRTPSYLTLKLYGTSKIISQMKHDSFLLLVHRLIIGRFRVSARILNASLRNDSLTRVPPAETEGSVGARPPFLLFCEVIFTFLQKILKQKCFCG